MKRTPILFFIFLSAISAAQALTLKESIGLALKNNPGIIASQKKADAAEAKFNQAVGSFLPTIKIDMTYGKAYTAPSTVQMGSTTFSFGTTEVSNNSGWTASLSQPLFVAALFPGWGIARKYSDMAKEDLRKTVLDTSFNVTQTYFGVIRAEKMVKLAQESKEMAQSHLNQIKTMLSAGVATQADFLRTEVQLANSDVTLTRAKNGLELARDAFNNALGNDLEQAVILEEDGFTGKVASLPEYKNLLEQSFKYRPDWKQYALSVGMSEENLKVARAAVLPTAMLTASTGNRITEYSAYKSDVNSWAVTGAASWTLFDGLGIQNRIREAADNLEAQKAIEDQVRNGIKLEVRDAYLSLKSGLETIGSAKKAVDSAEANHEVSTVRYSSGGGTNLEILDAQVALTQARINYYQALFDVEVAKARINKVVGKEVL